MSSISDLSPFCKMEIHFSTGNALHFHLDNRAECQYNNTRPSAGEGHGFFLLPFGLIIRVWRSLVSRLVRVQEAVGSNPATRTKIRQNHLILADFSIVLFGFSPQKQFTYFSFFRYFSFDHSPTTDRKQPRFRRSFGSAVFICPHAGYRSPARRAFSAAISALVWEISSARRCSQVSRSWA